MPSITTKHIGHHNGPIRKMRNPAKQMEKRENYTILEFVTREKETSIRVL
jgi:hypothetical protein